VPARPAEEQLNVYDPAGRVVGTMGRRAARASGHAVGAVNALVINGSGQVLLQRRRADKENGGLWDKTVGGHVGAHEAFARCVVREAGEELFGDGGSTRVRLARGRAEFDRMVRRADLARTVLLYPSHVELNLRDVRHGPRGGMCTVLYHVAVFLGRTDMPRSAFAPDREELAGLRYFAVPRVDRMLLSGKLAPNMAYLWLTQGHTLLSLLNP
jgi:8-oxo-dGTP pyrophosphatase MutT (NUDIX family)